MDPFNKRKLNTLMKHRGDPCISIYLPTCRTGSETRQNHIRCKNLVQKARKQLSFPLIKGSHTHTVLEPLAELLADSIFWKHQCDGLALFSSGKTFSYYRLPLSFPELVVVSDRFHLKPLLPLFDGDGLFYILALSQNEVRMFQGTHHSIAEIWLSNVPKNIREALREDEPKRQLHARPGAHSKIGKKEAGYHGYGKGQDDGKEKIQRFFHRVDRGLRDILKEEKAPLVFAGVEYAFALYQHTNRYPHLSPKCIRGNPEKLSREELHAKAWQIVKPLFKEEQDASIQKFQELSAGGQASSDIKECVRSAYERKVDTLFVARGVQQWGRYVLKNRDVLLHENSQPYDQDLLDFSAVHTLLNGGTVYTLPPAKVPGKGSPIAALFRF